MPVCVTQPWTITDKHVQELCVIGFSDEQIAEAALNVALFLAPATMADAYGLGDTGFHLSEIDADLAPDDDEIIQGDLGEWKSGI